MFPNSYYKLTVLAALLSFLSACSLDSQVLKGSLNSTNGPGLSNLLSSSTPILVQDLPDEGVVTSSNEASFQISGFCKFNGQEVIVSTEKPETKSVTCTDNAWSVTLDLSAYISVKSISDETVNVKITSGSFVTTLGLPRKLNSTFDVFVDWLCKGSNGCPSGQEAFAGAVSGAKLTEVPVQISCTAGKSINLKAYPYQAGATTPDATEEFNQTITCNPQGRALFTVASTNDVCHSIAPDPGCNNRVECRLRLKATQDSQDEDTEEVAYSEQSCAI